MNSNSTYGDKTFLHLLNGQRIGDPQSVVPTLSEIRTRHDTALDERDKLIEALNNSQNKLKAATIALQAQNCILAEPAYVWHNAGQGADDWLGFRRFGKGTTTYFRHIGFTSRGQPKKNTRTIWSRDMFVKHMENIHTNPLSYYISISDSPGHIINLNTPDSDSDDEIAVIDLNKLPQLGQTFKPTTEIK